VPIVLKSGSLNLLEPTGLVQAFNGIALPLPCLLALKRLLLKFFVITRFPFKTLKYTGKKRLKMHYSQDKLVFSLKKIVKHPLQHPVLKVTSTLSDTALFSN
jgi:hypothetical protein